MTDFKTLVDALQETSPEQSLRLRQGVIVSLTGHTAIVQVAGSATSISGIHYASSCCPIPGATCWLSTDGRDWFILATLAPAGPAFGSMRKSTAQSIPNAAWTEMTWGSRTDTSAIGTTLGTAGITVLVPGLYHVTLSSDIGGTQAAGTHYSRIVKNGASVVMGSGMPFPTSTNFASRTVVSGIIKCAAGDVVNGEIYQNAGGARDQDIAAGQNVLSVAWLGPAA